MQIAIVGLAGSGKTTVFNTLTRGHAQTGGFGGMKLHVGVVKVPDERLDRLAEIFHPKKIVHADVTYVDLPAPPASSEGRVGTEELPGRAPRPAARCRRAAPRGPGLRRPGPPAPGRVGRPVARPRAAGPRVHPGRPRDGRPPPRAAARRPAGTARRPSARRTSARRSILRAAPGRARGGPPDPRRGPRPGRGEGDPRLPVPDPEAGPHPAQRRRGRPARGAGRSWPMSPAATRTGTPSSTRCRPGSRWSSASSSPTRPPSSWRSWASPSRASTASSGCRTGCSG